MKKFSFTVALMLVLLVLSLVFVSCEGAVDPPVTYEVGAIGPAGGYIFYDDEVGFDIDEDGTIGTGEKNLLGGTLRYLEAAPSDIGDSQIFGYYSTTSGETNELVGTDTGIGKGQDNTTALVTAMGSAAYTSDDIESATPTDEYAAKLCADLEITANGVLYDDWFLPSKDELNQMYLNLKMEGLGGLFDGFYWSSSEDVLHKTYAKVQNMGTGNQGSYTRDLEAMVRPIRAF